MFKITKTEPSFFTDARARVRTPRTSDAWSSDEIASIRARLREYILVQEQNLMCAYCEKEIDSEKENSNIDHFKLRAGHLYPEKTLEYDNLLVSCSSKGRCSSHKDSHISSKEDYEKIVNPVIEDPDDFFDYMPTGSIVAKDDSEKARFTIDIFQLNQAGLIEQRLYLTRSLKGLNLSLEEILQIFNEFHSFIKIIYPKLQQGVTP